MVPKDAKIIIIEGIAGAGKTTLKDQLKEQFKHKKVYAFSEEEVLFGWKHIHLKGISSLRFKLHNILLDFIEGKLNEDVLFIIDRFHISLKVLELEEGFDEEYAKILSRVRKLPVHVVIPTLDRSEIKERVAHKERTEQWTDYLDEKLKLRGFTDIETMYVSEQQKVLDLAEKQGISFSLHSNRKL
jgi:thymidylate kinase